MYACTWGRLWLIYYIAGILAGCQHLYTRNATREPHAMSHVSHPPLLLHYCAPESCGMGFQYDISLEIIFLTSCAAQSTVVSARTSHQHHALLRTRYSLVKVKRTTGSTLTIARTLCVWALNAAVHAGAEGPHADITLTRHQLGTHPIVGPTLGRRTRQV